MAKKSESTDLATAVAETLNKPTRRFTIRTTEARPAQPIHQLVEIVDGVGYSDDPITAHTLQGIGYSVIDGLSGKEYTGTKPVKASPDAGK